MKSNHWLFLAVCMLLSILVRPAYTATEIVAGKVIARGGLHLTIEQRNGYTRNIKLNDTTPVVASPHASAPLVNRIAIDSKVSIIMKDGKPVVVRIHEVLK